MDNSCLGTATCRKRPCQCAEFDVTGFVFLFTALLTRHERVDQFRLVGACLGVAGVVLIVGPGVIIGLGQHVGGQLAVLAGAILYAGAAIYGKRFNTLPATVTAAATMIWASTFLIPASLVLDRP